MLSLRVVDRSLHTDAAPAGIISFELAGDGSSALAILDSWDQPAKLHAAFSLGLDFLFLIMYSTALSLGCIWASGLSISPLTGLGTYLAWGQWIAALFDGLENTALFIIMVQSPASPWPQIARLAATVKFSMIALGLLYIAVRIVERFVIQGASIAETE
jgi:hypothetical protein